MKKIIKKSIFMGILSISMAAQVSGSAEQVTAAAGSVVQAVVQAAANAPAAIALSVAAGAAAGAVSCVSLVSGRKGRLNVLERIADFLPADVMLACRATNRLWLNATRAHFNLAKAAKSIHPVQIGAPENGTAGVEDTCIIQLPGETPRVLVGSSDGSVRVVNLGDVPVPGISLEVFKGKIKAFALLQDGRV